MIRLAVADAVYRARRAFGALPSGLVDDLQGVEVFDRRQTALQSHHGARVRSRAWKSVTGITLHQTACHLGERPERFDGVGAHAVTTRRGRAMLLHDPDRLVAHGNGFNAQTYGIEIDGLYAGVEGDLSTVWDDPSTKVREQPMELTEPSVLTTCEIIRAVYETVAAHGGRIRALVAHRQASGSRRNDPGEAIWKRIALPMMAELGLSDGGAGFAIGDGRPVPEAWDPSRRGERY